MSKKKAAKTNKPMWIRVFHWTVIVVVLAVAIAGLLASGSPSRERARRLDETRVNNLESITYGIDQYWNENETLPQTLADLQKERTVFVQSISDPETGEMYEYRPTGERTYELCAVFATESSRDTRLGRTSGFWTHGMGRTCFEAEASPVDGRAPSLVR